MDHTVVHETKQKFLEAKVLGFHAFDFEEPEIQGY